MSETQIANELLHGNLCGSQHFLFEHCTTLHPFKTQNEMHTSIGLDLEPHNIHLQNKKTMHEGLFNWNQEAGCLIASVIGHSGYTIWSQWLQYTVYFSQLD
jgi:hypothetical protein